MVFQPKTVFITGGSSGIGKALAKALQKQGSKVIVAGRRTDALKELCAQNPGMEYYTLDVCDRAAVERAAKELPERYGPIECVINNAGMQRAFDLHKKQPLDFGDLEIDLNVRAMIFVTAAFLPHLLEQQEASLIVTASGLAYVPKADCPVYCATKAAAQSFTVSLRHQLKDTSVKVIELSPPAVQTELHDYQGPEGRNFGMPLDAFVAEAMEGLNAGNDRVLVGMAKMMASFVDQGKYEEAFKKLNS